MRNIAFSSINNNNVYINNNVMNNNGIDTSITTSNGHTGHNGHNGHNGHTQHMSHTETMATTKCSKPTNRRQSIATRQTKRPSSERRFKCDQCERMFFTRKDVKRHLVVHTGIRNFACPYCTQRFGRKDHLVRHAKKSHNRDTRSSASLKASQNQNNKAMPTLIQPKSNAISQQINNSAKSSLNYSNNQTADHSTLLLLTNNECASYGTHGCSNGTNSGINGINTVSDSMYVSGMHHSFDQIKSETHSIGAAAHHYFAFPVNSANYAHTTFIPQCFVTSNTNGINSCGSTSMAAFGSIGNIGNMSIPVPVCSDHSGAANAIHATISLDVNPSLPHFNQAFQ